MDLPVQRYRSTLALAVAGVLLVGACAPLGEVGPGDPSVSPDPGPAAAPVPPEPTAEGEPPAPTPRGRLNVSTSGWQTDFEIASVELSEIIGGGPGKDGIPAIDEPRFEPIEDARSWQDERAPVIALEVNGEARAYPLSILMWHEIVNDTLGGVPVVVTFCPLCNTALVFQRDLDGVLYDFGTTGNLRFSDLVMYDRQTESWWQQATGESIVGVLTGTRLPFVPSQIVALGDFAAAYPDALALSRETGFSRSYGRNPYVGYDSVDQNPFLFRGEIDGRLSPMERVVAVNIDDAAVAYPHSEVARLGVIHDQVAGTPVVVFWQPGVASALDAARIDEGRDIGATGVFSPVVDGERLTFEPGSGAIVDRETGSLWSIFGVATEGPLEGTSLEPIGHGDHFWFAWAAFEPETRIWVAGE
ncbi:MAG TPA: DUF3179 domain-containing protein [Candidatus Limnocylindrales bacterium]|jgi:hypothetical protein|nr:DUF3179 domain-containing protein [Candidatus Limnocylindrales bacterium]